MGSQQDPAGPSSPHLALRDAGWEGPRAPPSPVGPEEEPGLRRQGRFQFTEATRAGEESWRRD